MPEPRTIEDNLASMECLIDAFRNRYQLWLAQKITDPKEAEACDSAAIEIMSKITTFAMLVLSKFASKWKRPP